MCPKGTQQTGYWRLTTNSTRYIVLVDSDSDDVEQPKSECEELWESLRTIAEDAPELFCKPPDQTSSRYCGYINCYTPDHEDENGIRLAAEFIRRRVRHPYVIHYHDMDMSSLIAGGRSLLFEHTPEGELYKKKEHGMELVVDPNTVDSSSVLDTLGRLNVSDALDASEIDDTNALLPSEVFDKGYIIWPSTEEAEDKMWSQKGGKWMVFSPDDYILKRHDSAWLALLPLCKKGIFVYLKASTNVINKAYTKKPGDFNRRNPVINCYTADAENEADILKAAVAIGKALKNDYIMYYKPNSSREAKSVSKYMYTVRGGFYRRDNLRRFKLISTGEDNGKL